MIEGILEADNGCIYVTRDGDRWLLLWPDGYVARMRDRRLQIFDGDGRSIGEEGDRARVRRGVPGRARAPGLRGAARLRVDATTVSPPNLRVQSGLAAIVLVALSVLVLGRVQGGADAVPVKHPPMGTWVSVGVMFLSAIANAASSRHLERFLMGPLALLLGALCLIVAGTAAR